MRGWCHCWRNGWSGCTLTTAYQITLLLDHKQHLPFLHLALAGLLNGLPLCNHRRVEVNTFFFFFFLFFFSSYRSCIPIRILSSFKRFYILLTWKSWNHVHFYYSFFVYSQNSQSLHKLSQLSTLRKILKVQLIQLDNQQRWQISSNPKKLAQFISLTKVIIIR